VKEERERKGAREMTLRGGEGEVRAMVDREFMLHIISYL
jgi:hypothetical protein